jgi:hypothetical protein
MSATLDQSNVIVDSLRLNDRELAAVLARSNDGAESPQQGALGRNEDLPRTLVRICHERGNCTTFLVKPRRVHDHGMIFLHGSYVHKGALCAVLVRTAEGAPAQIPAAVFRCRHLSGRVHEVTAVFDAPVRLRDFRCADGTPLTAIDPMGTPSG